MEDASAEEGVGRAKGEGEDVGEEEEGDLEGYDYRGQDRDEGEGWHVCEDGSVDARGRKTEFKRDLKIWLFIELKIQAIAWFA